MSMRRKPIPFQGGRTLGLEVSIRARVEDTIARLLL